LAEHPLQRSAFGELSLRFGGEIGYVKRRAVEHGPPDH
jgi:hypothetical protein